MHFSLKYSIGLMSAALALVSIPQAAQAVLPSAEELAAMYAGAAGSWAEGQVENVKNSTFYSTPSTFSKAVPGDLIKFEKVSGTALSAQYGYPAGSNLWRMMYASKDEAGKTVPATAFILAPYSPAQYGRTQFQTVVWNHGTSGITRDCAPSAFRTLYYDWLGPYQLALDGYVVIGVDYAGEGSNTPFNYVNGNSHADDVSYSVVAARKALPANFTSYEWVDIGHSEGAMTAWATNEREAIKPIGGFLGSVAVAPSMKPVDINRAALSTKAGRDALTGAGSTFYPIFMLQTIARLDKTFNVSKYLTSAALDRLNLILQGGGIAAGFTLFAGLSTEEVFKDLTWVNSTQAIAWQTKAGVSGDKKLAAPLLVINAGNDEAVSPKVNSDTVDAHCTKFANQDSLTYSLYPGYLHSPVLTASYGEWSKFIKDRFAGTSCTKTCTKRTVSPKISGENVDLNFFTGFGLGH